LIVFGCDDVTRGERCRYQMHSTTIHPAHAASMKYL
jgi:hypothetical protein